MIGIDDMSCVLCHVYIHKLWGWDMIVNYEMDKVLVLFSIEDLMKIDVRLNRVGGSDENRLI